jgi:hypothetical protein
MAALKSSGAISATLFGILMANCTYQSILDIGGYDTANIKSGYSVTWIPTSTGQFFWELPFSGVRYSTQDTLPSDSSIVSGYSYNQTYGIMDTGTTLMYVPYGLFATILPVIVQGHSEAVYYSSSGAYTATCDTTTYQSIFMYINGYYYEMTPDTWLYPYDPTTNTCLIGIMDSGSTMFLVGDVFLKNYYSIWDDDNNQMALAPHIYSTATVTAGSAPTATLDINAQPSTIPIDWTSTIAMLSGSFSAFAGLGAMAYFVYFKPIL